MSGWCDFPVVEGQYIWSVDFWNKVYSYNSLSMTYDKSGKKLLKKGAGQETEARLILQPGNVPKVVRHAKFLS